MKIEIDVKKERVCGDEFVMKLDVCSKFKKTDSSATEHTDVTKI